MFGFSWETSLVLGGVGLLVVAALLAFLKSLFVGGRKKKKRVAPVDLREFLAEYPDPPLSMPMHRLLIEGMEVRLRFVAMVPVGADKEPLDAEAIPDLLDDFRHGLGDFIKADEPKVVVWPTQLSVSGFAPTFFRLVESPDAPGQKSRWVRAAGPVKIGGKTYLLGIAFLAEQSCKLGALSLAAADWKSHLTIEK
jgi:hypothetical protein